MLVVAVLAYAASYFARGWLAGHQRFGLYGGLVLLESVSRCLFALAVAVGHRHGPDRRRARHRGGAVGVAAGRAVGATAATAPGATTLGDAARCARARGFAGAVLAIMLAEQTLLNGPVLVVDVTATDAALAGFVFNVLLITRAPLQLFQSIQTSLLPHLSGLEATGGGAEFDRAIRVTVAGDRRLRRARSCSGCGDRPVRDGRAVRRRLRLRPRRASCSSALGMGFHLIAGTLNQAALARRRGGLAAAAWLASAALFMLWLPVAPRRRGARRRGGLLRHDRAAGRGAVGHRPYFRACALNVPNTERCLPVKLNRAESQRGLLGLGAYQL